MHSTLGLEESENRMKQQTTENDDGLEKHFSILSVCVSQNRLNNVLEEYREYRWATGRILFNLVSTFFT